VLISAKNHGAFMQDGIYLAQFVVGPNHGHGVAVKTGNRVGGGDSSYWWEGELVEADGGSITGNITIRSHTSGNSSVFGLFDQFQLALNGKAVHDAWQLSGTTDVAPGRTMQLNLSLLKAA
jgi:hypothetical protein